MHSASPGWSVMVPGAHGVGEVEPDERLEEAVVSGLHALVAAVGECKTASDYREKGRYDLGDGAAPAHLVDDVEQGVEGAQRAARDAGEERRADHPVLRGVLDGDAEDVRHVVPACVLEGGGGRRSNCNRY